MNFFHLSQILLLSKHTKTQRKGKGKEEPLLGVWHGGGGGGSGTKEGEKY